MREPFFSVGETVIRKGKYYPEADGEYVVTDVLTREDVILKYPRMKTDSEYYYGLDGFKVELCSANKATGEFSYHTSEKNLRKKYPPSSEGFHDMMQKIKDNVLEGVE